MAKNRHTYAKRLREMEKKRKAEEKRERRRSRKAGTDVEEETAEGVTEVAEQTSVAAKPADLAG